MSSSFAAWTSLLFCSAFCASCRPFASSAGSLNLLSLLLLLLVPMLLMLQLLLSPSLLCLVAAAAFVLALSAALSVRRPNWLQPLALWFASGSADAQRTISVARRLSL